MSSLSSSSRWSLQRSDNRFAKSWRPSFDAETQRASTETDMSPRLRMRRCLGHFNKQISVICLSTSSLCSCREHSDFLIYEARLCQKNVTFLTKTDFKLDPQMTLFLPLNTICCQNRARERRAEKCGGRLFLPDVYLHFTLTNEISK